VELAPVPPSSDTLIFVATYNERGAIEPLLDALLGLRPRFDVLIVDDSSNDGTIEYLRARAHEPRLRLIVRPKKLGVGSAHMLGWLYARDQNYSRIVTMDADLSHDPADVLRLVAALDAGADIALGSRFAPGGELDYRGWRRFLSLNGNRLARFLLRLRIAEYTNSLRAARLDRVPAGLVESASVAGYAFFMTCMVLFSREGLVIEEVPIHFYDRQRGYSKIPKFEIASAALTLIQLAVDRRRSRAPALPPRPSRSCPACMQPYRVFVAPGRLHCLYCFGAGPASEHPC
jgi:dolichol-phosphate mannosyltransferase